MASDTCTNCGYAAKRQNPDCGDHPTAESAATPTPSGEPKDYQWQPPRDEWPEWTKDHAPAVGYCIAQLPKEAE